MGKDHVGPMFAHRVKDALAALLLKPLVFDPGHHITRGPSDLVRNVRDHATLAAPQG